MLLFVCTYLYVLICVLVHVAVKGLQVSSTLFSETGSLILWGRRAGQRTSGIHLPLLPQGWGDKRELPYLFFSHGFQGVEFRTSYL